MTKLVKLGLSADEKHAWDPTLIFLYAWTRLRQRNGEPATDALRSCRFAGGTRGLDARSRRAESGADHARL